MAAVRPRPFEHKMEAEFTVEVSTTLLDLVRNVAAMDARLATVDDEIKKLRCEVGQLQNQTTNITAVARVVWVIVGLVVGAGGFGAIQAML